MKLCGQILLVLLCWGWWPASVQAECEAPELAMEAEVWPGEGRELIPRLTAGQGAGLRLAVVQAASQHLGVPYVWAGASPAGFDCSGLVQYSFREVGLILGRDTNAQAAEGLWQEVEEALPGDLYFWQNGPEMRHVALAIGDGYYIHAPKPGDVVRYGHISHYRPDLSVSILGNL